LDNRTKKTLNQVDSVYAYDEADQLTSETTGGTTTGYEYDANGLPPSSASAVETA
jgi:hypothetical protein